MKTIYPLVKNDPSYDPEKFRQFAIIYFINLKNYYFKDWKRNIC